MRSHQHPVSKDNDFPAIYQSPTIETLDDGSLAAGRRHDARSNQSNTSNNYDSNFRATRSPIRSTGWNYAPSKTPPRPPILITSPVISQSRNYQHIASRSASRQKQRRRIRRKVKNDFQLDEDALSVTVKTIDISARSAFDPIPPVSMELWHAAAQSTTEIHKKGSIQKRLSPSLKHLDLLHRFQAIRTIRQLQFSPSVGMNADIWNEIQSQKSTKRDGRYRSINPLQATREVLPKIPPLLSNRKSRLPMRCDVGFPNSSKDEIQIKENEIRLETQWEEASPRLIVLITSENIGQTVLDDNLPFAGNDLQLAKERNKRHFEDSGATNMRIKPNRYSVLAPPLDTTPGSALGWRPRPFYDRPTGMVYALASALEVEISSTKIFEPMLCTLTLYGLGPSSGREIFGKLSEDFSFPAGAWKNKVTFDAARLENGDLDPKIIDSWMRRKHKALFSFDPLLLCDSDSTLYLVLQVYRVTSQLEPGKPSFHRVSSDDGGTQAPAKKKGIATRIKHKLGKLSGGLATQSADDRFPKSDATTLSKDEPCENCPSQFIAPICYGLIPFCPNDAYDCNSYSKGLQSDLMKWPKGCKQIVKLYASPDMPEDQERFIEHMTTLALKERRKSSLTACLTSSHGTEAVNHAADSEPLRKGMFQKARQSGRSTPVKAIDMKEDSIVVGSASIFTSFLGHDFTQAMLANHPDFEQEGKCDEIPRLLVNTSGDCAIAFENDESNGESSDDKKRSDLIRLPPSQIPSKFLALAEFREVLFLPSKNDKLCSVDMPFPPKSLQNLLFIYPRLLKFSTGDIGRSKNKHDMKLQYSIRVKLLQISNLAEEGEVKSVPAFYNPSPWSGPPILDTLFSKVSPFASEGNGTGQHFITFRDEIKMRVPLILDGTYHIQFGVAEIDLDDNEATARIISETVIPLSTSSSRDPVSGGRVTTIIPNGSHRVKLGGYQLQFDTRLISSIHVSDPSTAMVLRDFPLSTGKIEDELTLDCSLTKSQSYQGAEPILDLKIPFYQIIAAASENSLVMSFNSLLFMHLLNIVNPNIDGLHINSFLSHEHMDDTLKFLMDTMQSMFELLRKIKLSLISRAVPYKAEERIAFFVKDLIDAFDESMFAPKSEEQSNLEGDDIYEGPALSKPSMIRSQSEQSSMDNNSIDHFSIFEEQGDGQVNDGGAVHLRAKDSVRAEIDLRLSKNVSKINITGTPFSRVAFGATKTDRWKAEAEHHRVGERFPHLLDDDETVVTSFTFGNSSRVDTSTMIMASSTWGGVEDDLASLIEITHAHEKVESAMGSTSFVDSSIAKRVRMAAQTIIAPCIAPVAGSKGTNSPQQKDYDVQKLGFNSEIKKQKNRISESLRNNLSKSAIILQGSDDENESDFERTGGNAIRAHDDNANFRAEYSCALLSLSFGEINTNESQSSVFAYEVILGLWVKAWVRHMSDTNSNEGNKYPPLRLWKENASSPIYGFYAHLDVLLPMCLKSLILRCSSILAKPPSTSRVILDNFHMEILFPFVGVLASCLLGEANSGDDRDESLAMALASTDIALDFLIGLATVIHPQHLFDLLSQFIQILRDADACSVSPVKGEKFRWTTKSVHAAKCSRHLRLRVVERFSSIGPYLALNFPVKFAEWKPEPKENRLSWTAQIHKIPKPLKSSGVNATTSTNNLLPKSGWLAELLVEESLLICSLSCEIFVSEALAHIESIQHQSSHENDVHSRVIFSLGKKDLLLFQSIGLHAIACVHELLIRRHALDTRYQTEQCRSRMAALIAGIVLEKSIANVRWLARMESTHKIRSLWLVCFSYILQEAPESLLRSYLKEFSDVEGSFAIHNIIRLLRLSSSTFQCLVDDSSCSKNSLDSKLMPWVLQESFNSICASIIVIIDECTSTVLKYPRELKKMAQGTVDLLLQILTVPQSAVTHLRTVGGALQALEKFGIKLFLEVAGDNLQHWLRVMQTLMNSISLSVRSIAVDFMISLLSESFGRRGTIDDITTIFATVLSEVVAREIALYSVAGLVNNFSQVETVVWPLRRALNEIEDANPLDDDRVDPQLVPILTVFCRSSQAIIDGVLIELKLKEGHLEIVGSSISFQESHETSRIFEADEESLFEAANFFNPEGAPLQRLRWLHTLSLLHESKNQYVEAGESVILCARTISDSLPHLRNVWMPSEFVLWNDSKRSLWLDTIGQDQGYPDRGNAQVMSFARQYLLPSVVFGEEIKILHSRKYSQPSVEAMCKKLINASKEAVSHYSREEGNEELAFSRLQSLLRAVMVVIEDHSTLLDNLSHPNQLAARKRLATEAAALRAASASISSDITSSAEKLVLMSENELHHQQSTSLSTLWRKSNFQVLHEPYYVQVLFSGTKPMRFIESTSIPTFFEWDTPSVCRVSQAVIQSALDLEKNPTDTSSFSNTICLVFGKALTEGLSKEGIPVLFRVGNSVEDPKDYNESNVYLDISIVLTSNSRLDASLESNFSASIEHKRFVYRKRFESSSRGFSSRLVELTVARPFPCALSRQRTLLTSEFIEGSA